jgi:multicomponent Na+:H+ antiporter subunit D
MSPVLFIAVPLLAAFISIISKKIAPYLLLGVGLFNIVLLIIIENGFVYLGGFDQGMTSDLLGIALLLDTYSRMALWLVNGLIIIISFLNLKTHRSYASIVLLAMAGLNGMLLTNDLFNFFVFLEISGIAAYLITASNKKPVSTFYYMIMGILGGSLFLFGVAILYAMTGTLNITVMAQFLETEGQYQDLILPFILMFIGLGVEVKLLPFNSWVKGVLSESNTFSGPMIASVYAGAMSFGMGRLITNLFKFEGSLLMVVTVILVAGVLIGDLMAFASTKAREILLFSSIAQAAIIALLFVQGILIWAVYLILANALSKAVMFLVINQAAKDVSSDETDLLRGLFVQNKLVGVMFTLATLSLMGLPLFVGFTIKLNFLLNLAGLDQIAIIILLLIASIVEGIYMIRLIVKLWYKGENELNVSYSISFKVVFAIIAIALLFFGTYSKPLDQLDRSIDTISEVVVNG